MKKNNTLITSFLLGAAFFILTAFHLFNSKVMLTSEPIVPYLNSKFPSTIPCLGTEGTIINCTTQEPPKYLSQTGAFQDLTHLIPTAGLIAYDLNQPLWTDGALKKRWIALPTDGIRDTEVEQIVFSATSNWQFPIGTVLIKHFEMPIDGNNANIVKRLETRFLIFTEDGGAYGVTYKWNEAGTDAELLNASAQTTLSITDSEGNTSLQLYDFPSRIQCITCHNANSGRALGLKTWQLNKTYSYSTGQNKNQLQYWKDLEMFANPFNDNEISNFLKASAIKDESASLALRVRSYLDSNCSHCHHPGSGNGAFDARFPTEMENKNLIYGYQVEEFQFVPQGYIIKPKDPQLSELWVRDNSAGVSIKSMPTIGKNLVDEQYIAVLTEYINSLDVDCLEEGCSCSDGILNGNETEIDCGGTDCRPCEATQNDCASPNGLYVSENTGKKVVLNWNPIINAVDYTLQGRPIGSSKWRMIKLQTTHFQANVRPNLDYEWRLRSNCGSEKSDWSDLAFFSTHNQTTHNQAIPAKKNIDFTLNLEDLQIYPNPSSEAIFIDSPYAIHQITIFNLQGKQVQKIELGEAVLNYSISLTGMELGTYFLQVQSEERIRRLKFVKL